VLAYLPNDASEQLLLLLMRGLRAVLLLAWAGTNSQGSCVLKLLGI